MGNISMREAYGRALVHYGELNQEVMVLDADTSSSTYSSFFAQRFPERFFNIGIAEPCMIDVAVGLALGGKVPFVNGFAAILSLRAMEQIRTCLCYARTNVKLAASYAGVSSFKDGPTHHAITDIAMMRALPEMTVIVPADSNEAVSWVPIIAKYDGPVYLRLSRAATILVHEEGMQPTLGKGLLLRPGKDVSLIC
jgi:transketolase